MSNECFHMYYSFSILIFPIACFCLYFVNCVVYVYLTEQKGIKTIPANNCLFKINNRNAGKSVKYVQS